MEMQVNPQLIRFEREKRAWSQSHLASVSGLSLRTVQRIEATGAASFESAGAIATAFSMSVSDFITDDAQVVSAGADLESQGTVNDAISRGWIKPVTGTKLTTSAIVALVVAVIVLPGQSTLAFSLKASVLIACALGLALRSSKPRTSKRNGLFVLAGVSCGITVAFVALAAFN